MPTTADQGRAIAAVDAMPGDGDPDKIIPPWPIAGDVDRESYRDPGLWQDAKLKKVTITSLFASTKHLDRANLLWHLTHPGESDEDPDDQGDALPGMGAQVVKSQGRRVIVGGHHRLAALWLLGVDKALVWQIKEQ
jgi:hypothetical protein